MSEWKIVEVPVDRDAFPDRDYGHRRPWIADHHNKTIYWGPPGQFHHELESPVAPNYYNSGWTMHRPGRPPSANAEDFESTENMEAIQVMREHLGVPVVQEHGWRFGNDGQGLDVKFHLGDDGVEDPGEIVSRAMIYDESTGTLHMGEHDEVHHTDLWPHVLGDGYAGYISHRRNSYQWYDEPPDKDLLHHTITRRWPGMTESTGYNLSKTADMDPHDHRGLGYWWNQKKPITGSDARVLAEYAKGSSWDKEKCEDFIDKHADDLKDISKAEFKEKFFKRFRTIVGSAHLIWKPGTWGKAIAMNGKVVAWTTGTESLVGGSPHHANVAQQLGLEWEQFMDDFRAQKLFLLQVRPDGAITECGNGSALPAWVFEEAGKLGLKPLEPGESWRFSNWWELDDDENHNEGPPNIVDVPREHLTEPYGDEAEEDPEGTYDWWHHRRPFMYLPDTHTVHLGPTGAYHSQLPQGEITGNRAAGYVFVPGVEATGGDRNPEVRAFGGVPKSVLQAISDHTGIPVGKQDEWKFGSVDPEEWSPGHWGKAIVTKKGDVYTWRIDGADGRPTHLEVAALFGLKFTAVRTFAQITQDGTVNDVTNSDKVYNDEDIELIAQMIGGQSGDSGYAMWNFG